VPTATISRDGQMPSTSQVGVPPQAFAVGVGAVPSHLDTRDTLTSAYFLVTPQFFTSIRTHLRGRDFSEHDTAAGEWVAIINESAAHRFWPDKDPLGQAFTILNSPDERPRKVIGIVRDIPLTIEGDLRPAIYTSYLQQPTKHGMAGANIYGGMAFMVRTIGDPMSVLPAARRVVAAVDPDRPLSNVGAMEDRMQGLIPRRGYFVFAITAFAITATLLAAIGIYGVMAYAVTQRTREIGIRVALGAQARTVTGMFVSHGLMLAGIGIAIGLAAALGITRLMSSLLFEVSPIDPATYGVVSLVLIAAAALASYVPALRAAGIDPLEALRAE